MRKCRHGGVYQRICRQNPNICLQEQEYFNGDSTVNSATLKLAGCLPKSVRRVEADEKQRGVKVDIDEVKKWFIR